MFKKKKYSVSIYATGKWEEAAAMEKAKYLQFRETDFFFFFKQKTFMAKLIVQKEGCSPPRPPGIFHSRAPRVASKPTLVAMCEQLAKGTGLWAESIAQLAVTTVMWKPTGRRLQPMNLAPGNVPQRWNSQPSGQTSLQAVYLCYRGGFAAQQALSSSTCVRRVGRSLMIPLRKDLHDLTYLAHKKSIPHQLDGIC